MFLQVCIANFELYEMHPLQVFVANPNKSPEVVQILAGNKERLLTYLGDFHTDKGIAISDFPLGISSSWMALLWTAD